MAKGRQRKTEQQTEGVVTASEQSAPVKKKTGRPKGRKSGYSVSGKALAQRRENNGSVMELSDENSEYNRRVIAHALEISSFAPARGRIYREEDIPLLQEAFVKYLEACERNCIRAGTMGACSAIGIDIATFNTWVHNKRGKPFYEFATTVQQILAVIREEMISAGKLHPVIGIFWQRNFDGLRNDTEQLQSQQTVSDDEYASAAAIRKKYGELLKE